jgi:hypothetical protein
MTITTVSLDNSDTLVTLILNPLLLELMTLAYCSQKIVFFVMPTTTLKVTTMKNWMRNLLRVKVTMMKIWMENLLIVTLIAKTLTMKTSMENLLIHIHISTGTSLGIESLKFYIWMEMTLLLGMMMYGNNLPLTFPLRQSHCLGLNPKRSWTACTTLVRLTLELRINRYSSNSRWPLVPFQLRKWE